MKTLKKMLLILAGVIALSFVVIQFFRPQRNSSGDTVTNDIATKYTMPPEVQKMVRTSCYDCHSNNTLYPWYAEVQPIGWFLNEHIQRAKRDLNFSEFGTYKIRRQLIKLQQIAEQVSEGEMPLPSYLIMHSDARLSQEQKDRLIAWANALRDSIRATYPADSLERRN